MENEEAVAKLASLPSRLLQRAALHASRAATTALNDVDGTRYEFALLVTLEETEPCSQAMLCRRTGIDRSDVTAVVRDLERAGHIARTEDPLDRRRKLVQLQAAGRDRLATLERAVAAAQDELLAGLSEADRSNLVKSLRHIDRHK